MSWAKVRLILQRELRDQLRDRRTLFTIVVLPLLLYPLIGMTMLQVAQFLQEHPNQILVLGSEHLPDNPPLIEAGQMAENLIDRDRRQLLETELRCRDEASDESIRHLAEQRLADGSCDAVLIIPRDFRQQLKQYREEAKRHLAAGGGAATTNAPLQQPEILYEAARDQSRIAAERLRTVMIAWRQGLVASTGLTQRIPNTVFEPFRIVAEDVSEDDVRMAATWSKILPFILIVWALTGAFYPAIDLCAGEKERGTLETLLSSPARRSEIVWGKLLTVMLFSMATSILNLISMSLTGLLVISRLPNLQGDMAGPMLGPPPVSTLGWLLLALVPISALFSALALALATMSRSTKEGQYYLMPLLLISMPLIMLAMFPATQLELGTSLIPVTGLLLLLRSVIEGDYVAAMRFAVPVAVVTGCCCLLAIRWAIDQFNCESVLFRESERFQLSTWLVHLIRDRGDTPTVTEAVICGLLLLIIRFFSSFFIKTPTDWNSFAVSALVVQIAMIAAPALLMAVILTKSPAKTLLLQRPTFGSLCGVILLAFCLHPVATELHHVVTNLYPLSARAEAYLGTVQVALGQAPHWGWLVLVMAIVPAICEELAFRGFILSGLRHLGHRWVAILLSSLFFGLAHGVIQQSIPACLFGFVLGYLAMQSRSLLIPIAFHITHNTLGISLAQNIALFTEANWDHYLFRSATQGLFQPGVLGACACIAIWILHRFRTLPQVLSEEEKLQRALKRQAALA